MIYNTNIYGIGTVTDGDGAIVCSWRISYITTQYIIIPQCCTLKYINYFAHVHQPLSIRTIILLYNKSYIKKFTNFIQSNESQLHTFQLVFTHQILASDPSRTIGWIFPGRAAVP